MALWNKKKRGTKPIVGARARAAPAPSEPAGGTAEHVVAQCCDDRAPVQVLHPDSGRALRGHFVRTANRVIRIDLPQTPQADCPPVGDWVCLPFMWRERQMVFMSTVRATSARDAGSDVHVGQPSEIAGADTRSAFRIPVYDPADLSVRIVSPLHKAMPRVQDVSATGIQVEWQRGPCPDWEIGSVVMLELFDEERKVRIRGRVVRRDRRIYGLYFFELASTDVPLPEAFTQLLVQLERVWLRRRNETAAA